MDGSSAHCYASNPKRSPSNNTIVEIKVIMAIILTFLQVLEALGRGKTARPKRNPNRAPPKWPRKSMLPTLYESIKNAMKRKTMIIATVQHLTYYICGEPSNALQFTNIIAS